MSGLRIATALIGLCLAGCTSIVPLDHVVVAYDMTTAENVERQLLLNIARARNNQPIHFTAVSSIAATYRVTTSAGIGPALTGNSGGLVVPILGTSAESSPTISIAPMQGDELLHSAKRSSLCCCDRAMTLTRFFACWEQSSVSIVTEPERQQFTRTVPLIGRGIKPSGASSLIYQRSRISMRCMSSRCTSRTHGKSRRRW